MFGMLAPPRSGGVLGPKLLDEREDDQEGDEWTDESGGSGPIPRGWR